MTGFRFSLQRVLEVKRLREEERRQAVAQAQAEAAACAQRLEEANEELLAAVTGGTSGVDPVLRGLAWHHRGILHDRATRLQQELVEHNRLLMEARGRLVAAAQERRVLERLKERRKAAHELDEARREQSTLDDLAGTRATRVHNRREG